MLLSVSSAVQAEPEAWVGSQLSADADWIFRKADRVVSYTVYVSREITAEGVRTVAWAARTSCPIPFDPDRCRFRTWGREIAADQFSIDPLLSEASLIVGEGEQAKIVKWVAAGSMSPSHRYNYAGPPYWLSPISLYASIDNSRPAVATGRLFGRELTKSDLDAAFLGFNAAGYFDSSP